MLKVSGCLWEDESREGRGTRWKGEESLINNLQCKQLNLENPLKYGDALMEASIWIPKKHAVSYLHISGRDVRNHMTSSPQEKMFGRKRLIYFL